MMIGFIFSNDLQKRALSSTKLFLMAFLSHCPLSVKRPRSLARLICSACSSSPALESTSNPRIKFARSLLRRRHRDSSKKILLEGHRLVLDAIGAGHSLDELYYTENALSRGPSLRPAFASAGSRAISVSDKVLASISDTVTPQVCPLRFSPPHFSAVSHNPRSLLVRASLLLLLVHRDLFQTLLILSLYVTGSKIQATLVL